MMTDYVTVRGFVATAPENKTLDNGTALSSFRMASTPRWFDAKTNQWVDGHTNWYTVTGFRGLAGSMALSLKVGQPVLVLGRLKVKNWESQGTRRTAVEIEAHALGHDLAFGTAHFTRSTSGKAQAVSSNGSGERPASGENIGTDLSTGSWPEAPSEDTETIDQGASDAILTNRDSEEPDAAELSMT